MLVTKQFIIDTSSENQPDLWGLFLYGGEIQNWTYGPKNLSFKAAREDIGGWRNNLGRARQSFLPNLGPEAQAQIFGPQV